MSLQSEKLAWLAASGEERHVAIQFAAEVLLEKYRQHYSDIVPLDVTLLAETLNAKVTITRNLESTACILPSVNGFDILVNASKSRHRLRSLVAHELGHILFFIRHAGTMVRVTQSDPHLEKKEESFCFDLARHLLAPEWLLERIGILEMKNVEDVFDHLLWSLQLSKDVAARVMLEDHRLFVGRADRWIRKGSTWSLRTGNCYAHPSLRTDRKLKKELRDAAEVWLECPHKFNKNYEVIGYREPSNMSAFVVAVRRSQVADCEQLPLLS